MHPTVALCHQTRREMRLERRRRRWRWIARLLRRPAAAVLTDLRHAPS